MTLSGWIARRERSGAGAGDDEHGRIIIFGIEDATQAIVGIRNPSLTNDVVLRAARMIKPAVALSETSVRPWTLDGTTLLTVEIPPNGGTLYQYDGACYVRRGTNMVPLSVEEIKTYLNTSGLARWELISGPEWMTIDDLDLEAVERYLGYRAERSRNRRRFGEAIDLLPGLKAVVKDSVSGQLRPTHAGIHMFGLDPQLPLPQRGLRSWQNTDQSPGRAGAPSDTSSNQAVVVHHMPEMSLHYKSNMRLPYNPHR
jgi:predicted HTH transcriptional regulator